LLAIACGAWFVNPAISLIVALAAAGAAGMVVTEGIYGAADPTSWMLRPPVLLGLSLAALAGAVVLYFTSTRIEGTIALLAAAIYCFRAFALARAAQRAA
jgi:hypothetical protein